MPRWTADARVLQTERKVRGGTRGVGKHWSISVKGSKGAEAAAATHDQVGEAEENVVGKEFVDGCGGEGFGWAEGRVSVIRQREDAHRKECNLNAVQNKS